MEALEHPPVNVCIVAFFFFQAEDGIRDLTVTGVQTCALPIYSLSIDKAGEGYTLTSAAGGLTPATSAAFAIGAGVATKLAFTTQPSTTAQSGVPLAQQPVVQLQDANSNPVSQAGTLVTATVAPAGATPSNATAPTGATRAPRLRRPT